MAVLVVDALGPTALGLQQMTFASSSANSMNTESPYVSPDVVVTLQDQPESVKNGLCQHLLPEDAADPAK